MREQKGITATTFTRRASLPPGERTASHHHVGSRAGMHPEDNPYITYGKPIGRTYVTTRSGVSSGYDDADYDDDAPRTRSSVVVRRRPYPQVERIRETDDLPERRPRRPLHPLVYVGVSMLCLVLFIAAYTSIPQLWQRHLDDTTYGNPRTYQVDANVGHGGVEHFIALNNHGTIEVLEIPSTPTNTNQPHLYIIVRLVSPGADLVPATLSFPDVNGDGKPDLQVTVLDGSNPSVWVLFNNGTTFVPKL